MTRRTALSAFIALFAMTLITLITAAGSARAQQNPNCCTYTVDVQGVPASCFPFRIYYRWSCLPAPVISPYTANGITIAPIPNVTPCPPSVCKLTGISLDGINFILPNEAKRFIMGNCCYLLTFDFDINGCIYIKVAGIPC